MVEIGNKNKFLTLPIHTGRREVIDVCYQKFGHAALSKLKHLIGREDVARELLQDVFVKLWQNEIVFEDERMLFGWIYRTCHNAGIDYLRSATYRRESTPHLIEMDARLNEGDVLTETISRQAVRDLCKKLTYQDAQIVTYVGLDEMTHEEAAAMLGISKKTVTRAIVRLRATLSIKEVRGD